LIDDFGNRKKRCFEMFAPEIPDDFPDIPERPWDPDDLDDEE
jgi:hypothetical protein